MVQKYRLKHKKHMLSFKAKDGRTIQSMSNLDMKNEMEEHPLMTLLNEFLSTIDPDQLDTLISQQQGASARSNKQHSQLSKFMIVC